MPKPNDPLEAIIQRMGKPSELILRVLVNAVEPLPGFEISRRVARIFEDAGLPYRRLDASTLHYALTRMVDDGLVERKGRRQVDVPAPHGKTYPEEREVYAATGLGVQTMVRIIERNQRLAAASERLAPLPPPAQGAWH